MTITLTEVERDEVIALIVRDLTPYNALEFLEHAGTRQQLIDCALVAEDLDFDGTPIDTYEVNRSAPALKRLLELWLEVSDDWLEHHAEEHEERESPESVRVTHRLDDRLETWATCRRILDRLNGAD